MLIITEFSFAKVQLCSNAQKHVCVQRFLVMFGFDTTFLSQACCLSNITQTEKNRQFWFFWQPTNLFAHTPSKLAVGFDQGVTANQRTTDLIDQEKIAHSQQVSQEVPCSLYAIVWANGRLTPWTRGGGRSFTWIRTWLCWQRSKNGSCALILDPCNTRTPCTVLTYLCTVAIVTLENYHNTRHDDAGSVWLTSLVSFVFVHLCSHSLFYSPFWDRIRH